MSVRSCVNRFVMRTFRAMSSPTARPTTAHPCKRLLYADKLANPAEYERLRMVLECAMQARPRDPYPQCSHCGIQHNQALSAGGGVPPPHLPWVVNMTAIVILY